MSGLRNLRRVPNPGVPRLPFETGHRSPLMPPQQNIPRCVEPPTGLVLKRMEESIRYPDRLNPISAKSENDSHYHHLDFLRACAVLIVFFAHLIHALVPIARTGLGSAGHFAVLMFFVHTSLVLFMSLDRLPPKRRFLQFGVRRVFRIYPLLIATVLVVLWLGLPLRPGFRPFL